MIGAMNILAVAEIAKRARVKRRQWYRWAAQAERTHRVCQRAITLMCTPGDSLIPLRRWLWREVSRAQRPDLY